MQGSVLIKSNGFESQFSQMMVDVIVLPWIGRTECDMKALEV